MQQNYDVDFETRSVRRDLMAAGRLREGRCVIDACRVAALRLDQARHDVECPAGCHGVLSGCPRVAGVARQLEHLCRKAECQLSHIIGTAAA